MLTNGSGALRLNMRRERLKENLSTRELCLPHPAGLLVPHVYRGHRFKHPADRLCLTSLLPLVGRASDCRDVQF